MLRNMFKKIRPERKNVNRYASLDNLPSSVREEVIAAMEAQNLTDIR